MSSFRSRSFGAVASFAEAISVVSYPTSSRSEIARERRPQLRKNSQNGDFVNAALELGRFSKAACLAEKFSFWTNGARRGGLGCYMASTREDYGVRKRSVKVASESYREEICEVA